MIAKPTPTRKRAKHASIGGTHDLRTLPAEQSSVEEIHVAVKAEEGVPIGVTSVRRLLDNSTLSAMVLSDLVLRNPEAMPVMDICAVLRERGTRAASGDLASLQSMLAVQAVVLDGVFAEFARRAALQKSNAECERMLRLALKAQSQSRTTAESLAVIQQGPMIFAKQANIAQTGAQQQVNNGVGAPVAATPAPTSAESEPSCDRSQDAKGAAASAPAPLLARARARKS